MSSAVSASAKGASYLVLIQVSSRALTFLINQILLRYLSPALFGASIQLELYSITVLYFARESFRITLQRQTANLQSIVNIAHIPVFLGVPLTFLITLLYERSGLPGVPYMTVSLRLHGLAALTELGSEPAFAVVQNQLAYSIRAAAETIGTIARCIVVFATVIWSHQYGNNIGVLPFAFGQLTYALSLFAIYLFKTRPIAHTADSTLSLRQVDPKDSKDYMSGLLAKDILKNGLNLYFQSAVKYVLTQGDSLIVTTISSLSDQGAYALASNYGGLVARMLFHPIEESSRSLFANLCAVNSRAHKPDTKGSGQARTVLVDILRFYNIIGVIAIAVGPSLAPTLLGVVAGPRWSGIGAGDVLATFCYYIPLLALNGVTEAFVTAVATNHDLQQQSGLMVVYFAGFAGAAFMFLKIFELGASGIVWANCCSMAIRMVWNIWFIKKYFEHAEVGFNIGDTLPNIWSIASAVGANAALRKANEIYPMISSSRFRLLIRDAGIAAVLAVIVSISERGFLVQCYRLILNNKVHPKKRPK